MIKAGSFDQISKH